MKKGGLLLLSILPSSCWSCTERFSSSSLSSAPLWQPVRALGRDGDDSPSSSLCPEGTYYINSKNCQDCPPGSFSNQRNRRALAVAAADSCTYCPTGSYTPLSKSTACLPCDSTYYNGIGSDQGYQEGGITFCVAPLLPPDQNQHQEKDEDDIRSTTSTAINQPATIITSAPSIRSSIFSSVPSSAPSVTMSSSSSINGLKPTAPVPSTPPSYNTTTTKSSTISPSFPLPHDSNYTHVAGRLNDSDGWPFRGGGFGGGDGRKQEDVNDETDQRDPSEKGSVLATSVQQQAQPYLPLIAMGIAILLSVILCVRTRQKRQQRRLPKNKSGNAAKPPPSPSPPPRPNDKDDEADDATAPLTPGTPPPRGFYRNDDEETGMGDDDTSASSSPASHVEDDTIMTPSMMSATTTTPSSHDDATETTVDSIAAAAISTEESLSSSDRGKNDGTDNV